MPGVDLVYAGRVAWLRLPASFWGYALLKAATPFLLGLSGAEVTGLSWFDLILLLLIVRLAQRSTLARGFLLAWDTYLLLFTIVLGAWPWSAAEVTLLLISASSLGLLLSPSLRGHVMHRANRGPAPLS